MTSVIRDSNLLPIPEEIAKELKIRSGSSVDVTRTADGFEVTIARPGLRQGAAGGWRTHAERMAVLTSLRGEGKRLGLASGLDDLIRMREDDDSIDLQDETT